MILQQTRRYLFVFKTDFFLQGLKSFDCNWNFSDTFHAGLIAKFAKITFYWTNNFLESKIILKLLVQFLSRQFVYHTALCQSLEI